MGSNGTQFFKKNIKSKTALMTGFDCYRTYLAFKNHFTKDNFDYFKYGGKTNATTTSFNYNLLEGLFVFCKVNII